MVVASWVIVRLFDGAAILETFNALIVSRLNPDKYRAVPIGQYLGTLNSGIKERDRCGCAL